MCPVLTLAQVDRHEDMLRSCLRAVDALAHLPGIQACGPFQAFMRRVVLISPILERYKQVGSCMLQRFHSRILACWACALLLLLCIQQC